MPNENNKNENGVKRFMKRCAEVWKILVGVGVVIALIAGFYGLDAVIATEKDLDIYKSEVDSEIVQLKEDFISSLEKVQRNLDLQFWNQKFQEYSDKEHEFKYKLKKNPNDPDLKEQYEYYRQKRIEAQKKINELIKSQTPTGG